MFKFLGAVIYGAAAAGTVRYFAMRPAERRATDVEQAKNMLSNGVAGVKSYFTELFQSKPSSPSTA